MAEEEMGFGDDDDFGFGAFGVEEIPAQSATSAAAAADPDDMFALKAGSFQAVAVPQGDPNIKPKVGAPTEDITKRTHNSVTLSWPPTGQCVTKLFLQAMVNVKNKGFSDGFDKEKAGGKIVTFQDPLTCTGCTVTGLQPTTEYVFRLVAKNPAGFVEGPATAGIATIPFAPHKGDKSGWLLKVDEIKPKIQEDKGTLRRLSLFKPSPKRVWFVLDGALLSWFNDIDGEEDGYCHLGKLKELSWASTPGNTKFRLDFNDGKSMIEIQCVSEVPTKTDDDVFQEWTKTITAVRAKVGNAQAFHRKSSLHGTS